MMRVNKLLVLGIGAYVLVLLNTLNYCPGIIHSALVVLYAQEDEGKDMFLAIVGSLFMSQLFLVGPIATIVINKFSARISVIIGGLCLSVGLCCSYVAQSLPSIFLTYGLLSGFGLGMAFTAIYVIVGEYFASNRHLALCTLSFVGGAGIFISGPFVQYLITTYGVHGSFLILGGITMNIIPGGYLLRPKNTRCLRQQETIISSESEETEKLTNAYQEDNTIGSAIHAQIKSEKVFQFKIFRNTTFWPLLVQVISWHVSLSMLYYNLQAYSIADGESVFDSAFLFTIAGTANMTVRIITGLAINADGISSMLLNFGSSAIAGIATLLAPLYNTTYVGKSVYSVFLGLYTGSLTALIAPVCVDMFGINQLSTSIGLLHLGAGIGLLIGPPIGELVIGAHKEYNNMFICSGFFFIAAAIFTLTSSLMKGKGDISEENNVVRASDDNIQQIESKF